MKKTIEILAEDVEMLEQIRQSIDGKNLTETISVVINLYLQIVALTDSERKQIDEMMHKDIKEELEAFEKEVK